MNRCGVALDLAKLALNSDHDSPLEPQHCHPPWNPGSTCPCQRGFITICVARRGALRSPHSLSPMDQHLTVSEAREFTGKSESTIKRLLREITGDPQHADRSYILPSAEEVERRKGAKEPYAWKIDRQLLLRRFPQDDPAESGGGAARGPVIAPVELVMQVLQEQLRSKDEQMRTLEKQLDRKDDQIASLNERMRESNVLMRELQQRLAIAPPKPATAEAFMESGNQGEKVTSSSPLPAKQPPAKSRVKPPKNLKRPGVWSRLFRSSK